MAARRSFAVRAIVGVLALLLLAVVAEGFSSAALMANNVNSIQARDNFRQAQYDTLLGWVGLPNLDISDNYGPGLFLHTNNLGMRIQAGDSAGLAPGERRVVCSGDSFTFGSGVSDNQTFCANLEHEFPHIKTLNMSQRGYGIDQAYLWYKRDALRFPHKLHVFAFISNDFDRMSLTEFVGYSKPILKVENSKLAVHNMPVPMWSTSTKGFQAKNELSNSRLLQLLQRQVDLSDSAKMARVDAQVWNVAEAVFTDLRQLNKERQSELVLVYLPTGLDYDPGAYDNRRVRMADFSKRSGIRFIDLTDDLRKVPRDSADWFFITATEVAVSGSSGHYTARGNAWAAQQIAAHLRTMPEMMTALGSSADSVVAGKGTR